jgi:hypothetical protein
VRGFKAGTVTDLAAKPVMLGAGGNLQRHCHRAIFAGIGHKFRDIAQAWHRIQRFGQTQGRHRHDLRRDRAGGPADFEEKWARDIEMRERMSEIIRKYGLNRISPTDAMRRSHRRRAPARSRAHGWTAVHNDCVDEAAADGRATASA